MFIEIEQKSITSFQSGKIILFGVRGRGKHVLEEFLSCKIEVIAFCDNNSQLHGSILCNLPVLPPDQLKTFPNASVS